MRPARIATVLAVFALAFGVGFAVAPPATALPPNCHMYCDVGYSYTPTLVGQGIDCASAQADLQAKLNAAVSGECRDFEQIGFCEKTTVITQACYCNGCCDYRMEGYIRYRCRWCLEF
jgi:hypothetical protein